MTTTQRLRNRRGQGGRLRGEIVAAASALLEERGGRDAVTLRAVARQAGIAAPSIYRHFADRDAVVAGLADAAAAVLLDAVRDGLGVDGDAATRLRAACDAYVGVAVRQPEHYRVLAERWRVSVGDAGVVPLLVAAVEDCVDEGSSASADPAADGHALAVALHGLACLGPDAGRARVLVDRLAALRT